MSKKKASGKVRLIKAILKLFVGGYLLMMGVAFVSDSFRTDIMKMFLEQESPVWDTVKYVLVVIGVVMIGFGGYLFIAANIAFFKKVPYLADKTTRSVGKAISNSLDKSSLHVDRSEEMEALDKLKKAHGIGLPGESSHSDNPTWSEIKAIVMGVYSSNSYGTAYVWVSRTSVDVFGKRAKVVLHCVAERTTGSSYLDGSDVRKCVEELIDRYLNNIVNNLNADCSVRVGADVKTLY